MPTAPPNQPHTTAPRRIQRQRTRGWRMPDSARYVGRPSRWGNPFSAVGGTAIGPQWFTVKAWPLDRGVHHVDDEQLAAYSTHAPATGALEASVRLFGDLVAVRLRDRAEETARWLAPLRGLDLACWCPLDQPCHADVLLELANQGGRQ